MPTVSIIVGEPRYVYNLYSFKASPEDVARLEALSGEEQDDLAYELFFNAESPEWQCWKDDSDIGGLPCVGELYRIEEDD